MVLLVHVRHHARLLPTHIHASKLVHLPLVHLLPAHHPWVLTHLLILHEVVATHVSLVLLIHAHAWEVRLEAATEVWLGLETLPGTHVLRGSLEPLIALHWIKSLVLLWLELHGLRRGTTKA